jgi:hypothetical protein
MRVESFRPSDIAKGDSIQLRGVSTTSGIYREQDWPCEATPDETEQDDGPKEPEEAVRI